MEAKREIHDLKIGKKVNAISRGWQFIIHKGKWDRGGEILEILPTYDVVSGKKLNMEKSKASFSWNIDQEKKDLV